MDGLISLAKDGKVICCCTCNNYSLYNGGCKLPEGKAYINNYLNAKHTPKEICPHWDREEVENEPIISEATS